MDYSTYLMRGIEAAERIATALEQIARCLDDAQDRHGNLRVDVHGEIASR